MNLCHINKKKLTKGHLTANIKVCALSEIQKLIFVIQCDLENEGKMSGVMKDLLKCDLLIQEND